FHAFLIIGYDDDGFLVRNSWGQYWGYDGYAVLAYDDWKTNGRHVYAPAFTGPSPSLIDGAPRSAAPESREREIAKTMWGHIVALDDEGRLSSDGLYAATSSTVRSYFYLFEQHAKKHKWKRPKLLVHADDGSQPRAETVERLAKVRDELMDQEIYPIFVVWDMPWRPDFEDELEVRLPAGVPSIMAELYGPPTRSQKRYEGFLADEDLDDSFMKYFLFEGRIVSETLAVELWRAIQRRSRQACSRVDGGARILAERISNKAKEMDFDIHIAAHGTGDFLLSQFAGLLPSIGSCHLWAPATTVSEFESTYGNLYGGGRIGQMAITVLDDASERADSIGKYPESILCLASNVLAVDDIDAPERVVENWLQIPSERDAATEWRGRYERDAEPILGLERCLSQIGGIASRAHVNVVSGAHADLAMSPDVLSAVVDRIKAAPTKATQPAREPTDSHDGDNDGTDLSPPAFVRDPLESARRRWEHPQASLVATRDPLSRARLAP
ncbi:MAG: hypothetical protein KJO18_04220, partial [Acidimicrobiia bacterium]|nr:hypothetical protein [Acidimicrobiia bacterium]